MKATNPKISVIVPVYKVEPYIHKCVDSILNQSYSNLEIILVNDGSPDNCGQICDELVAKHEQIKVLHQENMGLSMARNNGLKMATGSYISFIDSDDYIRPKMYEHMLQVMQEHDLELVECSMQKGDKIYFDQDIEHATIDSFDEAVERIIYPGFFTAPNKLYNYDLIKDIPFLKGKIYEDIIHTSQVWGRIDKIGFVSKAYYYYFQEGESIMRSAYTSKNLDGFWVIHQAMQNFNELARTERSKELLRKNYLRNLQFHFHSLLDNPKIDPDRSNLKRIHALILKNSKKPHINWYIKLITILPLGLYRIFYKLNAIRLKLKQ